VTTGKVPVPQRVLLGAMDQTSAMNCQQARELIDLRVHELMLEAKGLAAEVRSPGSKARGREDSSSEYVSDWSELEAHLDACPHCRAEFEELCQVRRLLMTAANDRPDDREVQTMWAAIQTAVAVPSHSVSAGPKRWWAKNKSLVVSMTGVAAVLMLAFQLGQVHYGESVFKGSGLSGLPFTNVDSSLPTASAEHETEASGWGIPAHPSQFREGEVAVGQYLFPSSSETKQDRAHRALSHIRDIATSSRVVEASPPPPVNS